jgi:WD40 repeat protein
MRSGCFSPNGKKILYVSGSFTFLYNSRTGKQLSRMCHNERCYSAAFSLDGRRIVTSARAEVAIWDAYHKKGGAFPLEVYGGHESCFFDKVSFSPNGQFILTTDGTVRLWDVKSGELQSFPECGKWVYSAVFSPNSQQLLTAHEDGVARLWQISFSE